MFLGRKQVERNVMSTVREPRATRKVVRYGFETSVVATSQPRKTKKKARVLSAAELAVATKLAADVTAYVAAEEAAEKSALGTMD